MGGGFEPRHRFTVAFAGHRYQAEVGEIDPFALRVAEATVDGQCVEEALLRCFELTEILLRDTEVVERSGQSPLVAEGTADQLKDTMGGDRVELTVAKDDMTAAEKILGSLGEDVTTDDKLGRLTVAAGRGSADLMAVMRQLEAQNITPVNIGLRRPSLDDVFLRLTDHTNAESSRA